MANLSQNENRGGNLPRRDFLKIAGAGAMGAALASRAALAADQPAATAPAASSPDSFPIIDTHIHLYDPFRPGGSPYPNPNAKVLYVTSKPARYRPIAQPLGIVGAVAIECSGLLEDNQWVLDAAKDEDIMVGTIGRLVPGANASTRTRSTAAFATAWAGRTVGSSTSPRLSPTSSTLPTPTW